MLETLLYVVVGALIGGGLVAGTWLAAKIRFTEGGSESVQPKRQRGREGMAKSEKHAAKA